MEESERVRVCGAISHLFCGILTCCVMAFFFFFEVHTEPAQLSARKSENKSEC